MMTHTGKFLTARGVKPIVEYRHIFKTTYLYGSYSPMTGDSFVWEINGVDSVIFEAYLGHFSKYRPKEFKIVVIDNAGFHSTKNIVVPENIYLLRIPSKYNLMQRLTLTSKYFGALPIKSKTNSVFKTDFDEVIFMQDMAKITRKSELDSIYADTLTLAIGSEISYLFEKKLK